MYGVAIGPSKGFMGYDLTRSGFDNVRASDVHLSDALNHEDEIGYAG